MLKLSNPQGIFLNHLNTKYRAYVGGFGAGKTFIGCIDILNFFASHPGTRQGYFSISYPSIRDVFFPTFEEAAHMMGFTVVIREGNKEIHVYRNKFYYGTVICRSMDDPGKIVGFKIARALVDEIDTLDPKKAKAAWIKIIARLRLKIDGVVNGIGVTTTPEGFKFVYNTFKEDPTESYSMVQASTYENEAYLPEDYISSLKESYSPELIQSYLMGEFVNLTSGTVYNQFDRKLNGTDEKIKDGEPLYIGMDFNVENMSAIVHIKRDKKPIAAAELTKVYDTPAMISLIKEKYPKHVVTVYPDASGQARKTVDALTNDIALLEQARFRVQVNSKNPYVRNRVTAMNSAFCNANGDRSYKVNVSECPEYTKCLEQQSYDDNGQPDKKAGLDHATDAAGYFITMDYPVAKPMHGKILFG